MALIVGNRNQMMLFPPEIEDYVGPEDIQDLAFDVLRHRIILSYEAEAEGIKAYASARRSLKKHEAALLTR